MAMKLLAHVLRSAISGSGPDEPAPSGSLELGLWVVFRDLVVRRDGYPPWGLSHAAPAGGEATTRREPSAEPLWADTQPWCHE
jgi:hypothetical protein